MNVRNEQDDAMFERRGKPVVRTGRFNRTAPARTRRPPCPLPPAPRARAPLAEPPPILEIVGNRGVGLTEVTVIFIVHLLQILIVVEIFMLLIQSITEYKNLIQMEHTWVRLEGYTQIIQDHFIRLQV